MSIYRKLNWANSVEEANRHNEGYAQGVHSWTKGVNQFSDGTRPGKGLLQPRPILENKRPNIAPQFLGDVQNQRFGEPVANEVEYYVTTNKTWEEYKLKFNKKYTNDEEPLR